MSYEAQEPQSREQWRQNVRRDYPRGQRVVLEAPLTPRGEDLVFRIRVDDPINFDEVEFETSGKDTVTVMGARGSRSSVILDLDADGDLDIVTSEFGDRPQVLVSDLSERKAVHSLEIHLEGTASNRNGFGSRVEVFSGGGSQVKVHDGKSGYLSQSVLPLYFGLGDSASVDRIEVTWPSGVRQTFRPAATERRISLVEPAANEDR